MRIGKTPACFALCLVLLLTCGCRNGSAQPFGSPAAAPSEPAAASTAAEESSTEPSSASPQTEPETEPVRPMGVFDDETAGQMDALLQKYGTVGAQVAVIRDGAVYAAYCFGYADRTDKTSVQTDTKFRCASLSKLITAMTVMAVQETGKLDLQKDIGDYLPFRVRNPRWPDVPVTCSMLMTHTSSILDSTAFLDSRNAQSSVPLQTLLEKRSSYSAAKPGERYSYSNFGVAVLADVAECATGQSFEALAQQFLFRPLGIDASYLAAELHDPSLTAALYSPGSVLSWSAQRQMRETACGQIGQTHHLYQGNLTISAADYAQLLCVLLTDGKYAQTQILRPQSVQQILSVQFADKTVAQGYCVKRLEHVVDGRSMWCHTGLNYGVHTSFAVDPSDRSGVVIFTSGANAQKAESELFDVCTDIIRMCCAQQMR